MANILGNTVGPIGLGLMSLTNPSKNVSYAQAIAVMKEALTNGNNFWNGGEFYGPPDANSLQLLREYFIEHPEDKEKVVTCIKGAYPNRSPDGSPEGVRTSVENCIKILDGKKKVDLFECARVDPKVPIETTIKALAGLVEEGKIGGIALSEANANTIRRAAKIHKISAVEVEVSLWQDHVLKDGVAEACAENDIPIIAYSPVGRGLLTGQLKSVDDLGEGDFRRMTPRFSPENFKKNLPFVEKIQQIAERKHITTAQLAINWVRQLSQVKGNPTFFPIPSASIESRAKENSYVVDLTPEELAEIEKERSSFQVSGDRYPEAFMSQLNG